MSTPFRALHPRAAAFEQNKAREKCANEGHLHPVARWYSSGERRLQPCRRGCGELVRPDIDFSGHP